MSRSPEIAHAACDTVGCLVPPTPNPSGRRRFPDFHKSPGSPPSIAQKCSHPTDARINVVQRAQKLAGVGCTILATVLTVACAAALPLRRVSSTPTLALSI